MGFFCCGSSSQKSRTLPKGPPQPVSEEPSTDRQEPSRELRTLGTFNLQELTNATENFSTECCVNVSRYGSIYKGKLEGSREILAVERLDKKAPRGGFVAKPSDLQHPNLVNLIGYCVEQDERIVVHEYLPFGSLEKLRHGEYSLKKPVDWQTRMKIALGIARGLEYMHHTASPEVIHRNLEPSIILLDDDLNPKISGFWLCEPSYSVTGTIGYIAPEYYMTALLCVKTAASDVYSFGVILLELITGRTRRTKEQDLLSWVSWAKSIMEYPKKIAELADPLLQGKFPVNAFNQAVGVAASCLREKGTDGPLMTDVVRNLMYISSGQYSEFSPA